MTTIVKRLHKRMVKRMDAFTVGRYTFRHCRYGMWRCYTRSSRLVGELRYMRTSTHVYCERYDFVLAEHCRLHGSSYHKQPTVRLAARKAITRAESILGSHFCNIK